MVRSLLVRSRLLPTLCLAAFLLVMGTVGRLTLALFDSSPEHMGFGQTAAVFLMGAAYDAAAVLWWTLPLVLLAWAWPARPRIARYFPAAGLAVVVAVLAAFLFVSLAEIVFWNEFGTRFNFIAVDYLVYTREVVGNIRESYSLGLLLGGLGLALVVFGGILARPALRLLGADAGGFGVRSAGAAVAVAALALATLTVDTDWKDRLGSPVRSQLAGNGVLEFFRAFRENEIDFERFYATLPSKEANRLVRAEFDGMPRYRLTESKQMPIERWVATGASQKRLNVILVSVESFGAEFIESLGGKRGLAPEFERLAQQGLYFTRLYATGTRTVRGLEALTLSVPPTPGHAVPMRPNNTGLFTLGGVFREQGYDAVYMYGGYSYFDNMKEFFGGNGYIVIDRTDIPKSRVTHETIWGVADEDLFGQALAEMDSRAARGRSVFLHVMTTSNHRPFTYPEGRIDIPSGSGRDGAVKYTDHAIGKFIRDASSRPWFADTAFVIVADHTSIGRGKTSLATSQFHIPMVIYSPKWIAPRQVDTIASQIDVGPTILGLLNVDYRSQFFGRDILHDGEADPHVFMANYQTVGFLDEGILAELKPRRGTRVLRQDTNEVVSGKHANAVLAEGIALYQVAADRFSSRRGKAPLPEPSVGPVDAADAADAAHAALPQSHPHYRASRVAFELRLQGRLARDEHRFGLR